MSVLFQYYRPVSLMIPVRWNILFLLINGLMVGALMKERSEASDMDQTMKDLFESEFERMGFTAVEFRRLFSTSEKIVLPTGTPLSIEKETQEKTYFLLSGQVDVKSGDSIIATVRRNHFIGEMSFLSYLQEGTSTEAAADCYMSDKEPAVVFVWDNTVLRDYLIKDDNRGVKNALQASISNDLRKKIQRMTTTKRSKN